MKKAIPVLFVILISALGVHAQDKLPAAFKNGDAQAISKQFAAKVDLVIVDDESVVNASEGRKKLSSFFNGHKPSKFEVLHSGESNGGMQYTIGRLETNNGNFRISYYLRAEKKGNVIQQLMIDED